MDPAIPEPALAADERQAFAKGVAEFNAGFYFECHDTLEELWSGVRGPSRDFFQGLIQISVAFHHLTRGNLAGAESLLQRALGRLSKYPDRYFGFDAKKYASRREHNLARGLAQFRLGEAVGRARGAA